MWEQLQNKVKTIGKKSINFKFIGMYLIRMQIKAILKRFRVKKNKKIFPDSSFNKLNTLSENK
ncbi:hypothetical protein GCM10011506_01130 [Marivirga lumbricoides]|uniref:Uncharacterized protein n=1 Tax=Marivirga lumbricoides TaxID=1046115 RepID=A0ABQ1L948_9BACT|nr:hypothetical protein GCM10011506_01130 [Marivirga lumbricoides]